MIGKKSHLHNLTNKTKKKTDTFTFELNIPSISIKCDKQKKFELQIDGYDGNYLIDKYTLV